MADYEKLRLILMLVVGIILDLPQDYHWSQVLLVIEFLAGMVLFLTGGEKDAG